MQHSLLLGLILEADDLVGCCHRGCAFNRRHELALSWGHAVDGNFTCVCTELSDKPLNIGHFWLVKESSHWRESEAVGCSQYRVVND